MTRTIPSEVKSFLEAPPIFKAKAACQTPAVPPPLVIAPPIAPQPVVPPPGWREFFITLASASTSFFVHIALLVVLAFMVVEMRIHEPHSIVVSVSETTDELSAFELLSEQAEMPQLASDEGAEEAASTLLNFRVATDLAPPISQVVGFRGEGFGSGDDLGGSVYGMEDGQSGMGSESDFRVMVEYAKRNGLDLVIVFDSTGSMSNEIDGVKQQIFGIGSALLRQVPSARIGLVTYRDRGPADQFAVVGLPLTNDLSKLAKFMQPIVAHGGGDTEEAVELGIKWAITQNKFRPKARKIILIFGDAPPHSQNMEESIQLARNFRQKQAGIVTTVTVRALEPLDEFYLIAKAGNGEAYTNRDPTQLMSDLLVLAFGAKHREDVGKFFAIAVKPLLAEKSPRTTKMPASARRRARTRP